MPQVMLINTRATWLAGPQAGLSTAYRFAPGVAVEVTDADAKLLLAGPDGREFVKAGTDVAEAAAVEAAAVATSRAGAWQTPKAEETEDAEPLVPPQDTAVEKPSASVSGGTKPHATPGATHAGSKGG